MGRSSTRCQEAALLCWCVRCEVLAEKKNDGTLLSPRDVHIFAPLPRLPPFPQLLCGARVRSKLSPPAKRALIFRTSAEAAAENEAALPRATLRPCALPLLVAAPRDRRLLARAPLLSPAPVRHRLLDVLAQQWLLRIHFRLPRTRGCWRHRPPGGCCYGDSDRRAVVGGLSRRSWCRHFLRAVRGGDRPSCCWGTANGAGGRAGEWH